MTSVLPSAELFAQGTPKSDTTRLFEYVRAAPSSTDAAYGLGGTGYGLSVWNSNAFLYSGWFGQSNSEPLLEAGQSATPAVGTQAIGTGSRPPVVWIPRELSYLDADVEMCWQEQSTNSAQLHSSAGARRTISGVCARLSGAALTNPGASNTFHAGGSGYFFGWCHDNGLAVGGAKYVLWRVNAGVCTRLADDPTGATTSLAWVASQPWRPRTLRMTVHTDGATVVIRCYRRVGGAGVVGSESLLFEYVDASGSRITASGRVGFFASCEQSQAAVWSASCVNYFQAREYLASGFDRRDEFARYNVRAGATFTAGSGVPFSGYDLNSCFFGDSRSSSAVGSLLLDDGDDRAQVLAGAGGTFTSQRPADDSVTQGRELTVRFASAGSADGVRSAGPALRVSHASGAGLAAISSYDLVLEYDDDASEARFALYRTVASARLLLAETGTTYDLDADRVLGLDVDANSGGAAVLRAYEDGIQVVLEEPASPVAGISVDGDGNVIDASSARVASGAGQGFYASVPALSTQALLVDTYEDLATVTGDLLEQDMASIAVPAEADGSTGTLEIPTGWPVREVNAVSHVRHELDLGNRYVSLADDTVAQAWEVSIPAWTDDEKAEFQAFVAAHRSAEIPFEWLPPGELEEVAVKFAQFDVDFGAVLAGPNAWAGTFTLERLVPA